MVNRARQRIVGLGLAVVVLLGCGIGGVVTTLLIGSVRSAETASSALTSLRGDFADLVSLREMLEAGDDLAPAEVSDQLGLVRGELIRALGGLEAVDADLAGELDRSVTEYVGIVSGTLTWLDPELIEATDGSADALARESTSLIDQGTVLLEAEAAWSYRRALLAMWAAVGITAAAALICLEVLGRSLRRAQRAESGRAADGRVRALIEHAPDIVAIVAPDGSRLTYSSPAVEIVLGHDPATAQTLRMDELVHPDDWRHLAAAFADVVGDVEATEVRRAVIRCRHASGDFRHLEMYLSNRSHDGDIAGIVINARDISDRVELERSLSHQASHDQLTGLANRASFVDLVQRELAEATVETSVAVVFLDLDGFKEINDSRGHGAGDEVLMTVAARLLTLTRDRDHVARLGGDEFALAVVGADPGPLAERLLQVVSEPIEIGGGPVQIGASVGIAIAAGSTDVDDLLRDADVAMYDAKARGKNRASYFEPEMHHLIRDRLETRAAIDQGLTRGEFRLAYQPEMSLSDGRLLGFEALVRWHRADGTVTPPNDFISLTESTGQIVALGSWVLNEALDQLVIWQQMFDLPGLTMAVNVSARQLVEPDFVAGVAAALRRAGADPTTLTLELTETTVVHDLGVANGCFGELRALGVRLAIDDYGAGHASIGYLREFPIDVLKIDRSFVWALDTDDPTAHAYLRSITDLAAALSIDTIAEGIEHPHQLESLRALGCAFGQGFHLARPLDPDAAASFIGELADRSDRSANNPGLQARTASAAS